MSKFQHIRLVTFLHSALKPVIPFHSELDFLCLFCPFVEYYLGSVFMMQFLNSLFNCCTEFIHFGRFERAVGGGRTIIQHLTFVSNFCWLFIFPFGLTKQIYKLRRKHKVISEKLCDPTPNTRQKIPYRM